MKIDLLLNYINELYPDARCELNYEKDYELLIAVMLSAQTTDKRVNEVTKVLFKKYDSIESLKNADVNDIEEIIRPLGTQKVKAKNIIEIAKRLSEKPLCNDRAYLESLSGVGRKTTNVVLSELYDEPYLAVDTHIMRVAKRLGLASKKDDALAVEKKLIKHLKGNIAHIHHQLIFFGRYHCKAKNPNCINCKLKQYCKEKRNMN